VVRFGSYSMDFTRPGTPSLIRLKSTLRYIFRDPPPRPRDVMRPRLLRPAWFCLASSRDFSGFLAVISSKEATTAFRVPGVIGLSFFNGIAGYLQPFYQVDAIALLQGDNSFLDVGPLFDTRTVALFLSA